jgi:hypothetical protein
VRFLASKNISNPLSAFVPDAETEERVGTRKESIGFVDRVSDDVPLNIWSGIKAGRMLVAQLSFVKMDGRPRNAIISVHWVVAEVKIA